MSLSALTADLALLTELHEDVLTDGGQAGLVRLKNRLVRAASADAPEGADPDSLDSIVDTLDAVTAAALTRTLTVHLHLTNLADERHRARSLRAEDGQFSGGLETGEIGPAVEAIGPEVRDRLEGLRIHPVLTAHPTEARRRAVTTALRRIAEQLDRYDDPGCGPGERAVARRRLLEDIDILQRTSTLRETSPEPQDEVKAVLTAFDPTVFRAVVRLYRAVEASIASATASTTASATASGAAPDGHPTVPAFVRFGTWVGGDRDGNPFVTSEVTRATLGMQADLALRRLHDVVDTVARTLTMDDQSTPASPALLEALANDAVAMPAAYAAVRRSSPSEPHRQKLLLVAERVRGTRAERQGLAYRDPEEMLADLRLVQESLIAAGDRRAAHGELQHLVWMVQTFGFHLAELEVRQHSSVHEAALTAIFTEFASAGTPVAGRVVTDPVSAARDVALLDALATGGWPAVAPLQDERTVEVLDTLRVLAWLQQRWGRGSCGRYIVSFSQSAAHLVAVRALARLAVGDRPLRLDVVPLFETGEDLRGATGVLRDWVALPSTRGWLEGNGGRAEIMLGYSDSAKDVGPASATLTLAEAQAELVRFGTRQGIELTLFHGRGGSLGRGGGPLHRAITAQPTGSVDGRFKVTEQGEVIFARYSDVMIAQRHLERVTSAVLLADHPDLARRRDEGAARFAQVGATVERESRAAYRALMDTPGVADLLAAASPLDELAELRLGSRPSRRSGVEGGRRLDDLRAIPWVFAWSMTRVNLPGWYGLGSGLAAVGDAATLRHAYGQWPLFASLIDVAEMSLAKVNRDLAVGFLALGGRPDLSERILAELDLTRDWVLRVLGQDRLLERKPHLDQAVSVRTRHIDALSRIQLRALRVLREEADLPQERREAWRRVLLLTVNGAAAGLQNTG